MSVQLPSAIAPWATALSLLHGEVTDGVGPWLAPLRQVIGSLALPRATETGDPDGLSGLARRGPYDRLVLSEWVLALEFPDEFVRRAVMGEHMFSSPAFRQPHGARTSVALLDAGPMQLGAPRLVQLAVLVVLAQRAADSGALFRFGALQDPDHALHSVDRAGLTQWASQRFGTTGPAAPNAWHDALTEVDARDVWVVGDRALREFASRHDAGFISVREPLVAGARSLDVEVCRSSAPGGRISLTLPDQAQCLRALRSPVGSTTYNPPGSEISVAGVGWLCARGDQLITHASGEFPLISILLDRRAPDPSRVKKVADGTIDSLIAMEIVHKRPVALLVTPQGELVLAGSGVGAGRKGHSISTLFATGIDAPPTLRELAEDAQPQFFIAKTETNGLSGWLTDDRGSLYALSVHAHGESSLTCIERGCTRLTRYGAAKLVWASRSQNTILSTTAFDRPAPELSSDELDTIVFGPRFDGCKVPSFGIRRSADTFEVFGMQGKPTTWVAPSARVIGLSMYVDAARTHQPRILALRSDRRSLAVRGDGDPRVIPFPAPLESWRWEPAHDALVWRTEAGHVGVDSFDPIRIRLRVAAPRSP